jgi:hypothetical protein
MSRILMFALASVSLLAALSTIGQGGDKKPAAWKQFLPDPVYAELTKRSLHRIGQLAKDEKAPLTELRAEALIFAGYTLSTKQGPKLGALIDNAVLLADRAGTKGEAKSAREFGIDLAKGRLSMVPPAAKKWPERIGNIKDVMMVFAGKAKGGEGIPAELQYNPKLKNQNGGEALINALSDKKPSNASVAKMAKELELFAYRTAVIGALTLERGPAAKGADRKAWDEQAVIMRDAAIELAEAARKKDGAAIKEACGKLENSCVECHGSYK